MSIYDHQTISVVRRRSVHQVSPLTTFPTVTIYVTLQSERKTREGNEKRLASKTERSFMVPEPPSCLLACFLCSGYPGSGLGQLRRAGEGEF